MLEKCWAHNFVSQMYQTKLKINLGKLSKFLWIFHQKMRKFSKKPHQNPMGFELKSPTPGVFQNQFPTPMGDGGGDPMGPPWGMGVGSKPYIRGRGVKIAQNSVHVVCTRPLWDNYTVYQENWDFFKMTIFVSHTCYTTYMCCFSMYVTQKKSF